MSHTETREFNLTALANGIAGLHLQGSMDGGLSVMDSLRLGVLFEAWGRLTGEEPPSGDEPDFESKCSALYDRMLEHVLSVTTADEDTILVQKRDA